jgi:tight adherence protein B
VSAAPVLGAIACTIVAIIGARSWAWVTAPRRPVVAARPHRRRIARRPRPHAGRRPGELEVAAWCERVAAGVRAGSSLTRAVTDADAATAMAHRPFPGTAHALARGKNLAEALEPVGDGPSTPIGLLAPVIVAAAELGGAAAEPLERVAGTLLARATEREDRRAASAQARLSARVLTIMPFGVLALLALAEPSIRHVLVAPAGITCLAAGSALNLLGWWWAHRLIGAPT